MTEPLKLDSSGIDKFILKAALREEPIFDAYRTLCKTQGNPPMDYKDFERKYYYLYHGNYDVATGSSSTNSSPVTISDLPIGFLEKVVERLSLVDCLALRKVSHNLRNLVDSTEIHCEQIRFSSDATYSIIRIGDLKHYYVKTDDDRCRVESYFNKKKLKEHEDDRNFQQVMLADASTFAKNPKLKIDILGFTVGEEFSELLDHLKSLVSQLDARVLFIYSPAHTVRPILEFLKPGKLEEIVLVFSSTLDQLEDVVETEQWKQAKKLSWQGGPGIFPLDKLLPFTEIQSYIFEFSDENLIVVRDLLLQSTRLKYCFFEFDYSDDEDVDGKERIDRIMRQSPAFIPHAWRLWIPNSPDHFQLEFKRINNVKKTLRITKVLGNTVNWVERNGSALH